MPLCLVPPAAPPLGRRRWRVSWKGLLGGLALQKPPPQDGVIWILVLLLVDLILHHKGFYFMSQPGVKS